MKVIMMMMNNKPFITAQNAPVKAMNKLEFRLQASKRIRKDNGLTLFSITGKQQSGKSSYGMLILHEVYGGNVDEIMKHIVFSMEDLTKILRAALDGGYRERCIMWDDASVTGMAARWMVDPKLVMYLSGLGDTLGIATKSLILTSPSGDMVKAFRNYPKYKILIGNGRQKYDRVARAYWIGKSPMDQRWCSVEFTDLFDTRVPWYEIYAKKRQEISLKAVQHMETLFQEQQEKENEVKVPVVTVQKRAKPLHDKWENGEFGKMTFKQVCIANGINHKTASNCIF